SRSSGGTLLTLSGRGKRAPFLGREQRQRALHDPGQEEARLRRLQLLQLRAQGAQAQLAHVIGRDRRQRLARLLEDERQQRLVVERPRNVVRRRAPEPVAVRRVVHERQQRAPERGLDQVLEQLAAAGPDLRALVPQTPV